MNHDLSRPLRIALLAVLLPAALAACGDRNADGTDGATPDAPSAAGADAAPDGAPAPAPEATTPAEPQGFDIASVPVSEAALGDFPYFTLPTGYRHPNRPIPVRDFDRVAVWTGDRLEWVELQDGALRTAVAAATSRATTRIEIQRRRRMRR